MNQYKQEIQLHHVRPHSLDNRTLIHENEHGGTHVQDSNAQTESNKTDRTNAN